MRFNSTPDTGSISRPVFAAASRNALSCMVKSNAWRSAEILSGGVSGVENSGLPMVAAAEKNLPMVVPGWEDSTLGNMFAAACIQKTVGSPQIVKSGVEYMIAFSDWYQKTQKTPLGFFQIGGGIAGDFPICVVPMLHQDLKKPGVPLWGYFCQISDSTTSYGSYSGAVPNEKITWGKLGSETPRFVIESDATIVAPLVFAYVLGQ